MDGDLSEWKEVEPIVLKNKSQAVDAMRLTSEINAETIWETSVDRDRRQQIGVYYAGIPIAHIGYHKFVLQPP